MSRALVDAAGSGDLRTVRRLLDHGISSDAGVFDPNDKEGCSALQAAAGSGNVAMVELLLERGADINAPDCWGGTALTEAAFAGQLEIVRLLISRGADVNADDDGVAALDSAMSGLSAAKEPAERARFAEMVRLLRAAGARPFW